MFSSLSHSFGRPFQNLQRAGRFAQKALVLVFLIGALAGQAQTAEQIIERHIAAIGGGEVLSQIKGLVIEYAVFVQGNEIPGTQTIVNGKAFRLESDFNGQKVIQVYTDRGGWLQNAMTPGAAPQLMSDEQYRAGKDQIEIGGPLFNYDNKGARVELLGKEDGAYKIRLVARDKSVSLFYIDPTTFLLLKVITKGKVLGQEMEIVRRFSNYKKLDIGLVLPMTQEVAYGDQMGLTSTFKKVQVNPPIDPAVFEMHK